MDAGGGRGAVATEGDDDDVTAGGAATDVDVDGTLGAAVCDEPHGRQTASPRIRTTTIAATNPTCSQRRRERVPAAATCAERCCQASRFRPMGAAAVGAPAARASVDTAALSALANSAHRA